MDELEIKRLLKTVYNKKWYVAFIILLFILAGYMYSYYYVTPKYKSETTIILIKNTEDTSGNEITQSDINLNQKLVSTYGEIIKSNKVLRKVIKNLNLTLTENQLYNLISVADINNTEILKITVVNEDSELAKKIANEVANVFSEEVIKLYKIDNVNVIDEAEEDIVPYNINHTKDILIFATLGIVISVIFVIAMYYFDSTIKEEDDVEAYIGVNLLSTIPIHQRYMKSKNQNLKSENNQTLDELITYEDYKSPIAEFFRTLRTNILFTESNNNIRTILVTSGMMGEGKSWVTANLATAFAQSNKSVLLIDSDMRKGRQHHIFKVKNELGLSNCLAMKKEDILNKDSFKNYILETKVENLHIMTSGNRPPNPSELLSSEKMKLIIETLKGVYDVIIFDGTPCMLVSDSIILSSMMDTSIIVAEYRKSKIENTKKLKKSIENAGGIIGGLVLNKLPISAKSYKSKYYYGEKNNEKTDIKNDITDMKPKTVEELINNSKDNTYNFDIAKTENYSNMNTYEQIFELKNMIEKYFNANNELMKKNTDSIIEIKSKIEENKKVEPIKKVAKIEKSQAKEEVKTSKTKTSKSKNEKPKKIEPVKEVINVEKTQPKEEVKTTKNKTSNSKTKLQKATKTTTKKSTTAKKTDKTKKSTSKTEAIKNTANQKSSTKASSKKSVVKKAEPKITRTTKTILESKEPTRKASTSKKISENKDSKKSTRRTTKDTSRDTVLKLIVGSKKQEKIYTDGEEDTKRITQVVRV